MCYSFFEKGVMLQSKILIRMVFAMHKSKSMIRREKLAIIMAKVKGSSNEHLIRSAVTLIHNKESEEFERMLDTIEKCFEDKVYTEDSKHSDLVRGYLKTLFEGTAWQKSYIDRFSVKEIYLLFDVIEDMLEDYEIV